MKKADALLWKLFAGFAGWVLLVVHFIVSGDKGDLNQFYACLFVVAMILSLRWAYK